MPVRASSSSAHASPVHANQAISGHGRVRSASPARAALAFDMRQIANLLRDAPGPQAVPQNGKDIGDASMDRSSICSSPHGAWEPGDRGATPVRLGRPQAGLRPAPTGLHYQFNAVAERVNVVISGLQRQCEADRRRLAQLERKVEARIEERAREGDGRQNIAEIQGSVHGLVEETQALTRRIEGLDERLWARTSGNEAAKQQQRALEQQIQGLEQQLRLATASSEETQKRHATKMRRAEHELQELVRRLNNTEEELRLRPHQQAQRAAESYAEARIAALEQQQEQFDAELRTLQMQMDECGLQTGAPDVSSMAQTMTAQHEDALQDAIQSSRRDLAAIEKKLCAQVEEMALSLASLRVKVDGQLQRTSTLADRLEKAHEPGVESLRLEITQIRAQDRRELDGEVVTLKSRLDAASESQDEALAECRESIRQARAEVAALSLRSADDTSSWRNGLFDRLDAQEREVCDMRAFMEQMQLPALPSGSGEDDASGVGLLATSAAEHQDILRRLEWLEEQNASGSVAGGAAEADSSGGLAKELSELRATQEAHAERQAKVAAEVARLTQRAHSGDSSLTAAQQQLQQLHSLVERRQGEEARRGGVSEVDAKVAAVSEQVAKLDARLLEVEGGLDFAKENAASHASYSLAAPTPVQSTGREDSTAGLQEKLEAVAEYLEMLDDLERRVVDLEGAERDDQKRADPAEGNKAAPVSPQINHEVQKKVEDLAVQVAKELEGFREHKALVEELSEVKASHDALRDLPQEIAGANSRISSSEAAVGRLQDALAACEKRTKEVESLLASETVKFTTLADTVSQLRDHGHQGKADGGDVSKQLKELQDKFSDLPGSAALAACDKALEVAQAASAVGKDLEARLAEVQGSVRQTLGKADMSEELTEMRQLLESKLKAQEDHVRTQLDTLSEKASSQAEAACKKLRGDLLDVSEQLDDLKSTGIARGSVPMEKDTSLEKRLVLVEDKAGEVDEELSEMDGRLTKSMAALTKRLDEELKPLTDQRHEIDATKSSLSALMERVSKAWDVAAEAKAQAEKMPSLESSSSSLNTRLEDLISNTSGWKKDIDKIQDELVEIKAEMVSRTRDLINDKAAPTSFSEELEEMATRLKALEEAKADVVAAKTMPDTEEVLKAEITKTVSTLTADVKEMLASLSKQQQAIGALEQTKDRNIGDSADLTNRVTALEQTATSSTAPGRLQAQQTTEKLDEMTGQLSHLQDRLKNTEEFTNGLRKDLEVMLPKKTVGISPCNSSSVSPLVALTDRIEELSQQVEDLKKKVKLKKHHKEDRSGSVPEEMTKEDASLNFSLTADPHDRRGASGIGDDSLEFSLTGSRGLSLSEPVHGRGQRQPKAPALMECDESLADSSAASCSSAGSLSISATDDARVRRGKRDHHYLEPLAAKPSSSSPTTAAVGLRSDILQTGGDALSSSSSRPRPSPLSGLEEDTKAALAPLQEEEVHSPESRRSGSASQRSPGLATAVSKASPASGKKSMTPAGVSPGKMLSPAHLSSPGSNSGVAAMLEASHTSHLSASCNEVSVSPDFSVSDSLELEKCDHWEKVQPVGGVAPARPEGMKPKLSPTAEDSETSPAASLSAASARSASAASSAAQSASAGGLSSAGRVGGPVVGIGVGGHKSADPAPSSSRGVKLPGDSKEDEDDYGHESFEDDMSVPESIDESMDESLTAGNS
eukprot:TRINITY_DN13320_c0_g1_i2.p1 TRINITY_DN13320_c0_g1~~TRINITY_DN13320_c0_g1_i2.p1  ORF type:complete len:1691 (+),score=429.72 TRINITY_DN13320_c0_g1_i2:72-5144(+)